MKLRVDKGTIHAVIELCLRAQYNQYTLRDPLATAMIKEELTALGLAFTKKFGKKTATVNISYAQALALSQVCEVSPGTDPHAIIAKVHVTSVVYKSFLEPVKPTAQHG